MTLFSCVSQPKRTDGTTGALVVAGELPTTVQKSSRLFPFRSRGKGKRVTTFPASGMINSLRLCCGRQIAMTPEQSKINYESR